MKKEKTITASLLPIDIQEVKIKIRGISPLIMHRFSETSKEAIIKTTTKQAKKIREAKNIEKEIEEAKYLTNNGSPAFPVIGFKKAMTRAGKQLGIKMTEARTNFFVIGEFSDHCNTEVTELSGQWDYRYDNIVVGQGKADIRCRPQLNNWTAIITVGYNSSVISFEQIINMLQIAGYGVGVGDWRPEKDGSFGRFEVIK